jgi:hypothetical protein
MLFNNDYIGKSNPDLIQLSKRVWYCSSIALVPGLACPVSDDP